MPSQIGVGSKLGSNIYVCPGETEKMADGLMNK